VISAPAKIQVEDLGGRGLAIRSGRRSCTLLNASSCAREFLSGLASRPLGVVDAAHAIRGREGVQGLARWQYLLYELCDSGFLDISVEVAGTVHASIRFMGPSSYPGFLEVAGDRSYVLSRFAYTRRVDDHLVMESPTSRASVTIYDRSVLSVVHALTSPRSMAALLDLLGGEVSTEAVRQVVSLFLIAGMALALEEPDLRLEDADPALRTWEFHDLLFHTQSREGRHDRPMGADFHGLVHAPVPPAVKEAGSSGRIDLFRPDIHWLASLSPTLVAVQEDRVSVRDFGTDPIGSHQLGEFLYRVARVKSVEEVTLNTPHGLIPVQLARRPYPSGGGLYELEVYLAVNRCIGVPPGFYWYNPLLHSLEVICGPTGDVRTLQESSARAIGASLDDLQVLLVISARFSRISWKYSAMAYAAILKHVGVLHQSMYLNATAMGLAPCAVGTGDADAFARVTGINYYEEGSVGEFLLGTKMG
jgi:SagB-type dehydrogenase family enzyme